MDGRDRANGTLRGLGLGHRAGSSSSTFVRGAWHTLAPVMAVHGCEVDAAVFGSGWPGGSMNVSLSFSSRASDLPAPAKRRLAVEPPTARTRNEGVHVGSTITLPTGRGIQAYT